MIQPSNRAPSVTKPFMMGGQAALATVSYDLETGKPFQIFLRAEGVSPEMEKQTTDFAIWISKQLQEGKTIEQIVAPWRDTNQYAEEMAKVLVGLLSTEETPEPELVF
jgi:hypothetical protein